MMLQARLYPFEGLLSFASDAQNTPGKDALAKVHDFVFLIKQLNNQSNRPSPDEIREIERRVQNLQREFSGWRLGVDLLSNEDPLVRFYGALTLTIKINADWDKDNLAKDADLRQQLFQQILLRYAYLTNLPDLPFVLRKLCSTLVAYFSQPTSEWRLPIRGVLAAIFEHGSAAQSQCVTQYGISDVAVLLLLMETITYQQLRGILWLSLSLVEDVSRSDPKSMEGAKMINHITENGDDIWQLLTLCLQSFHMRMGTLKTADTPGANIGPSMHDEQIIEVTKDLVLPTALAWMKFAPPETFEANSMTMRYIDGSIALITRSFQHPFMADRVLEILTGMAQSAPRYFERIEAGAVETIIKSTQAETWVAALRSADFSSDAMQYPEFLVSLVELEDLSSPDYFVNQTLAHVIPILQLLLQSEGPAVVEDLVCSMVLEAFGQIAEGFVDWTGEMANDAYMKDLIASVCRSCLFKVQYPEEEMTESTQTWDASDRSKFKEFRNDVEDFFLSSFSSLGPRLVVDTASLITNGTTCNSWEGFEAGLFCLGTLSESMTNDTNLYDSIVTSIFSTERWNAIIQNTSSVPSRARHGAINYISRNTAYLQRHQEQLVPCLNFLFSSLRLHTSTTAASRAIHTLCTAHRSALIAALPQFITTLTQLPPVPSEDKQRLFGAVASIIQALPSEERKLQPLSEMLEILSQDFQTLIILSDSDQEDGLSKDLDLLQSLAAIGKGLRTPVDATVDLDSEDHPSPQYWKDGPGKPLQDVAVSLFNRTFTMSTFRLDEQIVAAACDFLKAGYTEEDPSPFKFAPEVSVEFFNNAISLSNPGLNVVMASASAFLASSQPKSLDAAFPTLITTVINTQRTLLSTLEATNQYADHDFTYSSLDFFVRLLPKWGAVLFSIPNFKESLQVLFEFALTALENPDTLPRRSSASFWAALFELSGYPAVTALPSPAASTLFASVQQYSARFTAVLLRLLGGECARSELDTLSEPLRKFVSKHTQLARGLLQEAVKDDAGILTERALAAVDLQGRLRFVGQVEALRGGRKTNEVVREFWVACRGSAFGYTA